MASNAVWYDLCAAVQTGIQALNLTYSGGTALNSSQVYIRKRPTERNIGTPPAIVVCLGGNERYDPGDFEDIIVTYPILVITLFSTNQNMLLNADALLWRQKMIDMAVEFETTIRPNVPSADVSQIEIETNPVVEMSLFRDMQSDVGALLLRFRTARARSR